MKRRLIAFVLSLTMIIGMTNIAYADEIKNLIIEETLVEENTKVAEEAGEMELAEETSEKNAHAEGIVPEGNDENKPEPDEESIELATPLAPLVSKNETEVIVTVSPSEGADGYIIERNEDGGKYHQVAELAKDELVFADQTAPLNTGIRYRAKAFKIIGEERVYSDNSPSKKTVIVEKTEITTLKNRTSRIWLEWRAIENATGYSIYRSVNDGDYVYMGTVNALTWDDTDIVNGNKYSYKINVKNGTYVSGKSEEYTIYRVDTPSNVALKSTADGVLISYDVPGTSMYYIYKSTDGINFEQVKKTKKTSWVDTDVVGGVKYYYRVKSRMDIGDDRYYGFRCASKKITYSPVNVLSIGKGFNPLVSLENPGAKYNNVQFAIWSDKNGQDDIAWYHGYLKADGSYAINIESSKILDSGLCYIDCYGDRVFLGGITFNLTQEELDATRNVLRITDVGYNKRLTLLNPKPTNGGIYNFAVWSKDKGQDDIKWYNAQKQADGSYSYVIPARNIKSPGECIIHMYCDGVRIAETSFEFDKKDYDTRHAYYDHQDGFFYYENPIYANPEIVFVGDSRFTLMMFDLEERPSEQIAMTLGGAYYDWFINTAVPYLHTYLAINPQAKIIINMGVNDCAFKVLEGGYEEHYIETVNSLIAQYPKAHFYYAAVGPVTYGAYDGALNKDVLNATTAAFNDRIKKECKATYIDDRTYLDTNGFSTRDGLHYDAKTNNDIYNFLLEAVLD